MKQPYKKIILLLCTILACASLTGCASFYEDENGDQHFMLFGKHGKNGELIEDENSTENISGTSLKKGWTSSDPSILRGKNVSVNESCNLFSINLSQDKEVIITYDIDLDKGEYQLIYVSPDNTEQILQDSQTINTNEKLLFTKGQNKIMILSDNAIFKSINISIEGIETSDFK